MYYDFIFQQPQSATCTYKLKADTFVPDVCAYPYIPIYMHIYQLMIFNKRHHTLMILSTTL